MNRIMDVLKQAYESFREDEERKPIAPHVAPELPFYETRKILVGIMARLPERGQKVVFDSGERQIEDTPRMTEQDISYTQHDGRDLVVLNYDRSAASLDLFNIPRQETGYALTVLLPPQMPDGTHSSMMRDCDTATALKHPCATLRVYNGEGVTIASAVDVQRFPETMSVRAASVVFVKDGWDIILTQILGVGAVFAGIPLAD